jgi:hypothetical protein
MRGIHASVKRMNEGQGLLLFVYLAAQDFGEPPVLPSGRLTPYAANSLNSGCSNQPSRAALEAPRMFL